MLAESSDRSRMLTHIMRDLVDEPDARIGQMELDRAGVPMEEDLLERRKLFVQNTRVLANFMCELQLPLSRLMRLLRATWKVSSIGPVPLSAATVAKPSREVSPITSADDRLLELDRMLRNELRRRKDGSERLID